MQTIGENAEDKMETNIWLFYYYLYLSDKINGLIFYNNDESVQLQFMGWIK